MTSTARRLATALGTPNPIQALIYLDAAVGAAPETVIANQLGPIRTTVAGAGDVPAAGTASLQLVDDGLVHVDAELIRIQLTDAALVTLFGSSTSPAAVAARNRWTGFLTDCATAVTRSSGAHRKTAITAAGVWSRLANEMPPHLPFGMVGADRWALTTGDGDAADYLLGPGFWVDARIAQLAGPDPADPLSGNGASLLANRHPTNAVSPVSQPPALRDYPYPPLSRFVEILAACTDDVGVVERRDGLVTWFNAPVRQATHTALTIPASAILEPLTMKLDTGSVFYDAAVTLADGTVVQYWGYSRGVLNAETALVTEDQALTLGALMIDRRQTAKWLLDSVTVDLLALIEDGQLDLVRALLTLDPGALVKLDGLPNPTGLSGLTDVNVRYWLASIEEQITRSSWLMTLRLTSFERYRAGANEHGTAWDEVTPAGLTWNAVNPALTWNAYT